MENPKYSHPPIIERLATLHGQMDEELFERNFESWRSLVLREFPCDTSLTQYLLNMQERDGIPNLDTMDPELVITPRFSKLPEKEGYDWSLRTPPGKITLNMHSKPGDGRSYVNLQDGFKQWFTAWATHFEVEKFQKLQLHYANLLSKSTTPGLFQSDGGLALGDTLAVFANVPGEHEHLEPPFDCTIGVKLDLEECDDAHLRIHVKDTSSLRCPRKTEAN